MKKYSAIIIDDEFNLREALRLLLEQNCPNVILKGSAASASEGRELLNNNDIDLIFLDISMPGEDGFTFLKSIEAENFSVIFVTAYQEYALKALKANAVDYLLKPVDYSELVDAVRKAIEYLEMRRIKPGMMKVYSESISNLSHIISKSGQCIEKITIPEQFGFRIVEVKEIMYLEADGNYTIVHFSALNKLVVSRPLGELEKLLENCGFFRIHKSSLINMSFLKSYSSYQGNYAELSDGTKLDISRRKVLEFKEQISRYSKVFK